MLGSPLMFRMRGGYYIVVFDSNDVDPVLQGRTYNWDDYNIAVPTFAWDAAVGSTCLVLVTISLGFLLWRVLDAIRLKKNW